jgi:tetratricopeptide (TPR) repeat protein
MHKAIMNKILILIAASILTTNCASLQETGAADLESCHDAYTRHLETYSAIDSKDNGATTFGLEREVLSTLKRCAGEQSRLLALLANIALTQGENDKALIHARLAERLDSSIWETNAALGDVLTLQGNFEQGLIYLDKASRLAPKNIFLKYNLCANYEMAKHYEQAIIVCTKVIETAEPRVLGPALYVRARAYEAIGHLDKAESDFKRSKAEGFDGAKYYSKDHFEGGITE